MTTLKEVAELAGVSITTASHALNRTRFVQPETAERVFGAAAKLGYSPNVVARGLRTGSSRTIGVIGPSAQDPFFAEVVAGIERVCYARALQRLLELDAAAEATRRMLAQADPPTAILYWSDAMAIAGMDVAREHGVSVPLDLSIVGFDDLPIAGRVSPRLSSIRQETVDIGESMARRLIDRIEGKLQGAYGRIVSPTLFIERESTSARRA